MQTFALLCCVFVGSVSTAWNYMWVGTLPAGGLPCGSDCSYGRLVANWWLYIGGARNCYQCQCWLHMFLIRALCNPHGQLSWLLLGSEFWCSYPNDHRWRWMSRKRTMIITTMIGQVCVGVGKCNVSFEGIAFGREGARQHWTQSYYTVYCTMHIWHIISCTSYIIYQFVWRIQYTIQWPGAALESFFNCCSAIRQIASLQLDNCSGWYTNASIEAILNVHCMELLRRNPNVQK